MLQKNLIIEYNCSFFLVVVMVTQHAIIYFFGFIIYRIWYKIKTPLTPIFTIGSEGRNHKQNINKRS